MSEDHKKAFEAYIRTGETSGLRALEVASLTSNPDGGYLVPSDIESEIAKRLSAISPIRSIAGVRVTSSGNYRKPTIDGEMSFPAMELYAMPAATATLLEDAAVNIDQWLAQEVEQVFAPQEGAAFITGDGANKPKGFLSYDAVPSEKWTWGKLGLVEGGLSPDTLIDLIYSLNAGYRQNAAFVMNRKTQSAIRKLKDSNGNYLWQPPTVAGGRACLLTFPVVEAEDMPDIGLDRAAIAFGDFERGYLVVDRAGVSVLRDPYTAKPYVLFYTTKRVGGGVQDFDAIKLLKITHG